MILADENIHSFITGFLRDNGFQVVSVQELSKGIKDEQVIQWAIAENLTILTEDKDFGEWVFAHHIKTVSVIFLRYSFQDYKSIAEIIYNFLKTKTLIHPVFVTITTKKIRSRQL